MQARRDWQEIFKVMRSRDLQPRLLYPTKMSFRMEGQMNSFPDKKKLKDSSLPNHYYMKCKRDLFKKKKKIKTMNIKMTTKSQLSTMESK